MKSDWNQHFNQLSILNLSTEFKSSGSTISVVFAAPSQLIAWECVENIGLPTFSCMAQAQSLVL